MSNMLEPHQAPVTKLLRRKSSFDDYQRRLVDKIKRHFERRRKQWEKNIENQVKHVSEDDDRVSRIVPPQISEEREEEERLYINIDSTSGSRLHPSCEASQAVVPKSVTTNSTHHSADTCQQITIVSTETTDFPEEGKTKYSFIVDIKSFLPFGSVTVCQEENGLLLVGESNCSNCRSRGRRRLTRTHEKHIEVGGQLDNESMRVHRTREGIMRIDVVAITSKPRKS